MTKNLKNVMEEAENLIKKKLSRKNKGSKAQSSSKNGRPAKKNNTTMSTKKIGKKGGFTKAKPGNQGTS